MADESLTGPQSAYNLAKTNAASVFAVKVAQSGGLIEACEVGKIAIWQVLIFMVALCLKVLLEQLPQHMPSLHLAISQRELNYWPTATD